MFIIYKNKLVYLFDDCVIASNRPRVRACRMPLGRSAMLTAPEHANCPRFRGLWRMCTCNRVLKCLMLAKVHSKNAKKKCFARIAGVFVRIIWICAIASNKSHCNNYDLMNESLRVIR